MSDDAIRPNVDKKGVPWCDDRCPSYDGKRCERTGFRPDRICEPAVIAMVATVRRALRSDGALSGGKGEGT